MSKYRPITSKKRAGSLSASLFLLGLATLVFTQAWWPGIMLIVGLPVALRQFLLGRNYDMLVTLTVFIGTFITATFDISWQIFLPILFTIGAIYIFFKEFLGPDETDEREREAQTKVELEEDK